MNFNELIQLTVNYGLGIVLSIGMAIFMGWLLKYVLQKNDEREKRYNELITVSISQLTLAIRDHDQRTLLVAASLEEANKRQREEHELHHKSLEKLILENEYRKDTHMNIIRTLEAMRASLIAISLNTGVHYSEKSE